MKKQVILSVLAGGLLASVAAGYLTAQDKPGGTDKPAGTDKPGGTAKPGATVKPAAKPKPAQIAKPVSASADAPDHTADEEAVRKQSAGFSQALERGDAKALAGFWSDEGEYTSEDGTTIRGRPAIEQAYATLFTDRGKLKVEVTIGSIRFLSHDSALEEGDARVTKGDAPSVASRYSALHVRENGHWLMAMLREWPQEGDTLADIDWLIGDWAAKTENGEAHSTYEYDDNKKFIRVRYSVKGPERTVSGSQTIGIDYRTGQLRSWLFGSDGGHGEDVWSRDGKQWLLEATAVTPDGSEVTSTNIFLPLDKDSFTWQSVNRTLDGEAQPDIAPVKVTRVK